MVADQDIVSRTGVLLAGAGERLSRPSLERIRQLAAHAGIVEPILVRIPTQTAPASIAGLSPVNGCSSEHSWPAL
jgi:hypothetical protein